MTESNLSNKHPAQLFQNSDLPADEIASRAAGTLRDAAVLIALIKSDTPGKQNSTTQNCTTQVSTTQISTTQIGTTQIGTTQIDTTQWDVLFIRRTTRDNDRHSGQVAFPGGGKEEQDTSLVDTALRETFEETGIAPDYITVLGALPDYQTISNFRVCPIVGVVNFPGNYSPSPHEVARIFTIPLSWLSDYKNFEVRPRSLTDQKETLRKGTVIYYKQYDGELLWGATARMTLNFIKALKDGSVQLPE